MREELNKPVVSRDNITFVGQNLARPESVLCQRDGSLFVSHKEGGITHISRNGEQKLIGQLGIKINDHELVPNGIYRNEDGSFLLANIGEGGGIWSLSKKGTFAPHLIDCDGVFLAAANFVTKDNWGRTWITVSTVSQPRYKSYNRSVRDGLIILEDDAGARIVNDSIAFANECRVSNDGKKLFISETFDCCITSFDIGADGSLTNRQKFVEFSYGDFPDGCCFDDFGHLWVSCIVSNRLYRVSPDGAKVLVLEDSVPDHMKWVEEALQDSRMGREHFYETKGTKLKNIASVAIGGPEGKQVYMGALADTAIATFTLPDELIQP